MLRRPSVPLGPVPTEPRPPWVVFPGQKPTDPMTQGAQEAVKDAWCAFWEALGPEERAAYFNRWNAPPEWRSTIEDWWSGMTPEKLAEEARESEKELARWRAENPPRRTWLRRLFGRG